MVGVHEIAIAVNGGKEEMLSYESWYVELREMLRAKNTPVRAGSLCEALNSSRLPQVHKGSSLPWKAE